MAQACDKIADFIKRGDVLGQGAQGTVYSMPDGKHVIKAIPTPVNGEVLLTASQLGISPMISDIQICDGVTYYIQERMARPFRGETDADQLPELITRMIEGGLLHNDVRAENMMVDGAGRLYLIDFDMGELAKNIGYKRFDSVVKFHGRYEDYDGEQVKIPFSDTQVTRMRSARPAVAKTDAEIAQEQKLAEIRAKMIAETAVRSKVAAASILRKKSGGSRRGTRRQRSSRRGKSR